MLAPPLHYAGPDVTEPDRLKRWFATFDGPIDYEVRDLTVIAGEEVGFGHSLNRLSANPQGSTERFTLWFRSTVGAQFPRLLARGAAGATRRTRPHLPAKLIRPCTATDLAANGRYL